MSIQFTSVHALPQAKRLMHVEKSGPAFAREFVPVRVADQLGASLVAQTTAAIGDVLSAIKRGVLLDVIPAWQRLLAVQGVVLPKPLYEDVLVSQRAPWAYDNLLSDVISALANSRDGSPLAWLRPDMVIKQMAREQATRSEVTLMGLTADWLMADASGDAPTKETLRQSMVTVTNNIATLRAFSEGK